MSGRVHTNEAACFKQASFPQVLGMLVAVMGLKITL